MAHEIFISHSAQDKTVADAVCHGLEREGLRCWIAPRDINPGLSWAAAIQKAVRESRVLVLIFSGAADRSDHVRREVSAALEGGAAIVPFRLEDIRAGDELNYYLAGLHWLDATTPPLDRHVQRLADNLKAMLDDRPETTPADLAPLPRRGAARPFPAQQTARRGGAASWLWAMVALAALFILPIVALVWWGLQTAGDVTRTAASAAIAAEAARAPEAVPAPPPPAAAPSPRREQAAPAPAQAPVRRSTASALPPDLEQTTRDALELARQATSAARSRSPTQPATPRPPSVPGADTSRGNFDADLQAYVERTRREALEQARRSALSGGTPQASSQATGSSPDDTAASSGSGSTPP